MEAALLNDAVRVEWDKPNKKEIERYKNIYRQARNQGRLLLNPSNKKETITSFRQALALDGFIVGKKELSASQFVMRVIDNTGDSRLIWDSGIKKDVKEAAEKFEKLIDKGWRAYAVDAQGDRKRRRIYAFDAQHQEVYFDDKKTIKQRIENFVKSFQEIKMVPKTYAG